MWFWSLLLLSRTAWGVVTDSSAVIGHAGFETSRNANAILRQQRITTTLAPAGDSHLMRVENARRSRATFVGLDGANARMADNSALVEVTASTFRDVEAAAIATSLKLAARSQHKATDAQTLFVVYSDSAFYDTRLRWVRNTWAKDLPKSQLLVIGDAEAAADLGVLVHKTQCPPHSHWEGACCKYAEAVIVAHKIMQTDSSFAWAYFTDDDSYVRTGPLQKTLSAQAADFLGSGITLGLFGCGEEPCTRGLCAGGGYAANAKAVDRLVNGNTDSFLSEQMTNCQKCNRWADLALTQEMRARKIDERPFPGLNGWKLSKSNFDATLAAAVEPLMFHYIRSQGEMEMLHRLFSPAGNATAQPATFPLKQNCASFHGNMQCATPGSDVPWLADSSQSALQSSVSAIPSALFRKDAMALKNASLKDSRQ